tara:strand:- start:2123 stop:4051 length:1929 start_codon:yes stop_codon:yes gene_type:complete
MNDFQKDKDYLGNLKKKLYKKDVDFSYKRQKLEKEDISAKTDWEAEPAKASASKIQEPFFQSSLLIKLFFISLLFFVLAGSIAAYRLFIDPIVSSPQNLDITVQAPASLPGGEETSFQVIITNNNKSTIEAALLEITYPEGTQLVDVPGSDNRKTRTELGAILPGQQIAETVRMIVFGEENTEKTIALNIEYRAEGSSATFSKDKIYEFVLTTSPASLSVDIPNEVNVGEEAEIMIDVVSNSKNVLEDFMVNVEYPFGFEFVDATPSPTFGNNVWYVGDLAPAAGTSIVVRGVVNGQIEDQKTFKIFAGIQDEENTRNIDVVYNSFIQTVLIKKPFLAVNFSINGDSLSDEIVLASNGRVSGDIKWSNNLSSRILNGSFSLKINGDVVNKSSVTQDKGFYQSGGNTIVWNQTTDRTLSIIEPGESGSERFDFKTKPLFGLDLFKNPSIDLLLEFTGERVSPGFPSESIRFTQSKKIKINSDVQLSADGFYFTGPFTNSGPLPPKVDNSTTYTIDWTIFNSSNRISNASVVASLPIYVTWLNTTSPSTEDIVFNESTGEIVWDVGDIPVGVNVTIPVRKVSFQVGLTPSISQINLTPVIISESRFTGKDTFTGAIVDTTSPPVNTVISKDFGFDVNIQSRVVP